MSRELTHADLQGSTPAGLAFVCGDGLFGCGQTKGEQAFYHQRKGGRSQPTLCDDCINHKVVTYGVPSAHGEILILLLHQEISLFKQARTLAKPKDITADLHVMKAGHVERLRELTRAIIEGLKAQGRRGIEAVNESYHQHWFQLLGVKRPEPPRTETKTLALASVPVGDR